MAPRPDIGQSEFIEAIFTCKGNYYDPDFPHELEIFNKRLHRLLNAEQDKLVIKKVEPWNSVKVTVNIPKDAAERLKILASQNNGAALRSMGIMSLQMEGDRIISLTLSNGKNTHIVSHPSTTVDLSLISSSSPELSTPNVGATLHQPMSNMPVYSNLVHPPPSSSKLSVETIQSISPHMNKPVKAKAERRPRRVAGNSATTTHKRGGKVKNSHSDSGISVIINKNTEYAEFSKNVADELQSTTTFSGGLAVSITAEHEIFGAKNRLTSQISSQYMTSKEIHKSPVIHSTLQGAKQADTNMSTASITGVTDRESVNTLVASFIERSLASVDITKISIEPKLTHKTMDSAQNNSETDAKLHNPMKNNKKSNRYFKGLHSVLASDLTQKSSDSSMTNPDLPDYSTIPSNNTRLQSQEEETLQSPPPTSAISRVGLNLNSNRALSSDEELNHHCELKNLSESQKINQQISNKVIESVGVRETHVSSSAQLEDSMECDHQSLRQSSSITSESDDYIIAKELMMESVVRSPSTMLDAVSHDSSSSTVEMDQTSGIVTAKPTNSEFHETMPVIESELTASSLTNDVEEDNDTIGDNDETFTNHRMSSSHNNRSRCIIQSPPVITDGNEPKQCVTNLLENLQPVSLYNPAKVPTELPDEILEDDHLSSFHNQSPIDFISGDEANIKDSDTADDKPIHCEPVSVICAPPRSLSIAGDAETNRSYAKSPEIHLQMDKNQLRSNELTVLPSVIVDIASNADSGLSTSPYIGLMCRNSEQHSQMANEHETTENGSSTSTDSGVVPGSPKSDLCATPPSVEDNLKQEPLATMNEKHSAPGSGKNLHSSKLCLESQPVFTSDSTIANSAANRPCVSILRPVQAVHVPISDHLYIPTLASKTSESIAYHKQPQVSKSDALSFLMNSQVNVSEVLLAAANAASADQHSSSSSILVLPESYRQQSKNDKRGSMLSSSSESSSTEIEQLSKIIHPAIFMNRQASNSSVLSTYLMSSGNDRLQLVEKPSIPLSDIHGQAIPSAHIVESSIKGTYTLSKDNVLTFNNVSVKQKDSIPKIQNQQIGNRVQQSSEISTNPNQSSSSCTTVITVQNKTAAREESNPMHKICSSDLPTLPNVTVINSQIGKSRTLQKKQHEPFPKTVLVQPNCDNFHQNDLALLVANIVTGSNSSQREPSPPQPMDEPAENGPLKLSDQNMHNSKADNGLEVDVAVNGCGSDQDSSPTHQEDVKELPNEVSNSSALTLDTVTDAKCYQPLISPTAQRKSERVRVIRSPEHVHCVTAAITKGRKRSGKANEDVGIVESNEVTLCVPPSKRIQKQPAPNKVTSTENCEPQAEADVSVLSNGPDMRSKRATRSSGITDLQALPTIYRERKKTKR